MFSVYCAKSSQPQGVVIWVLRLNKSYQNNGNPQAIQRESEYMV